MVTRPQRLYRINEAAEVLAVSRSQIYRWIDDGTIRSTVKVGTRGQRITDEELDHVIERLAGLSNRDKASF